MDWRVKEGGEGKGQEKTYSTHAITRRSIQVVVWRLTCCTRQDCPQSMKTQTEGRKKLKTLSITSPTTAALRARGGSRRIWTWSRADTSFAITPWLCAATAKSSTREWSSYAGCSASSCPGSRATGSASARPPTARRRCAGCRWTSRWTCIPSSTPAVWPLRNGIVK